MKKILIVMLVLVSLTTMAFASGQQDGGDDMIVVGLSQESLDHPFMITQRDQVIAAAEAMPNVKVIATDGQGSVVKQVAGIEDMLIKGIDILLVQAAKAEGLKQELKKVHEKGIPFMFVGKPIHGTDAITMVSMDNYLIGTEIGDYVVEHLKAKNGSVKGNVVVIEGIPGDETSVNRVGGFHEVIDTHSGIKVVAQQPADYRRPQAVSVMQNVLQANPAGTLDVIFAANGEMALGAVQAVKDAGRLDEVIIIGLDGQQEEFDAIAAGEMAATWTYEPCGTQGYEIAMQILNGESVDPEIIPASRKITKDNVAGQKPAF